MNKEELIGNKFNRLLVISREPNDKARRRRYKCLCDCGQEKIISGHYVRTGLTKSCGCLQKEAVSKMDRSSRKLKPEQVKVKFHGTSFNFIKEYSREDINFIYKITNISNNKSYIGKTERPLYVHLRRYLNESSYKVDMGSYIKRAIKKYGPHLFTFEIIHYITDNEDINALEKFYIIEYSSKNPGGYNLTDGGEGSLGFKYSEEYLANRRGDPRLKHFGERNPFYGKTHSEETKQKIRESNIRRGELNKLKKLANEKIS